MLSLAWLMKKTDREMIWMLKELHSLQELQSTRPQGPRSPVGHATRRATIWMNAMTQKVVSWRPQKWLVAASAHCTVTPCQLCTEDVTGYGDSNKGECWNGVFLHDWTHDQSGVDPVLGWCSLVATASTHPSLNHTWSARMPCSFPSFTLVIAFCCGYIR